MSDQRIPSVDSGHRHRNYEEQASVALKGHAEQGRDASALRFANIVVEKRGRIDDVDFKALTHAVFAAVDA